MHKICFILISGLLLNSCNPPKKSLTQLQNNQSFIINGTPATSNYSLAASVVAIFQKVYINDDPVWILGCTGTVLNPRQILTASHCAYSWSKGDQIPTDELLVSFSLQNIPFSKQVPPETRITEEQILKSFIIRKIAKIKANPAWYQNGAPSDVAVVTLTEEAPATAKPVKFLSLEIIKTLPPSFPVIVMGYGLLKESPSTESDVLRYASVNARIEDTLLVTDQSKGFGSCNGDSGGPAFLQVGNEYYQIGITHGPYKDSTNCSQEGELLNPTFVQNFIQSP